MLIGLPPPQSQLAVQALGGWNHVIPDEYQLGIWDDFEDYFFFKASFSISTMIDRLTEFTLMTTEGETQELLDLTRRFETETLTTWQQFLLPEIIQKVIDSNTDLEFHRWSSLVDLCSRLISDSDTYGADDRIAPTWEETVFRQPDATDLGFIDAPPMSKEFWAWQFSRVVALARNTEYPGFEGTDDTFFEWGNGIVALSLLLSSGKPPDWAGRRTGAFATSEFQPLYDENDLRVTSNLYWIMHLGVMNVIRQMDKEDVDSDVVPPEKESEPDVLLLGHTADVAKTFLELINKAELSRLEEITIGLRQRLPEVWDMLSEDVMAHLIDAQLDINLRRGRDASLDYANAVESFILELPLMPDGDGWWPRDFREWIRILRDLTNRSRREFWTKALIGRCDTQYARPLFDALDLVRTRRVSRAHGDVRAPLPIKVQEAVLGGSKPSIFELILRFSLRW